MAFIRLADLIINVDYIATVIFSTYSGRCGDKDILLVNIRLMIPEGSLNGEDSETEGCLEKCRSVERLDLENDLAIAIWNYFVQSNDVTVPFE